MEKIRECHPKGIVSTFVSFGTVVRVLLLCHPLRMADGIDLFQRRGCFVHRSSAADPTMMMPVDVRFIFSLEMS